MNLMNEVELEDDLMNVMSAEGVGLQAPGKTLQARHGFCVDLLPLT